MSFPYIHYRPHKTYWKIDPVTLITSQGCPFCAQIKLKLIAKNIKFTEIDSKFRCKVQGKCYKYVPVIETSDGKAYVGNDAFTYLDSLNSNE